MGVCMFCCSTSGTAVVCWSTRDWRLGVQDALVQRACHEKNLCFHAGGVTLCVRYDALHIFRCSIVSPVSDPSDSGSAVSATLFFRSSVVRAVSAPSDAGSAPRGHTVLMKRDKPAVIVTDARCESHNGLKSHYTVMHDCLAWGHGKPRSLRPYDAFAPSLVASTLEDRARQSPPFHPRAQ